MNKIFRCLFIFLWMALLIGLPAAIQAADFTVTTLADESDGSCSDGDCSLRDAIDLSPAGSNIQFGVAGTIALNAPLVINKSLTLSGPGADRLMLDGQNAVRVLTISAAHGSQVSLSGLTIANGNSGNWFGGNIYNNNILEGGSTLTINRCIVRGGHSIGSGGGLASNGPVTISNTLFEENTARTGGGIHQTFHDLTLNGVTFSGNAAGEDGGALYAHGNGDPITVTITASYFLENSAARHGGAIRLYYETTTHINASQFSGNVTTASNGKGGAIASEASLTVDQSVFHANQAGTATTTSNTGGAIYIADALTLTNSTLYDNRARAAGGAIHFDNSDSSGLITNSTIYGNSLLGIGADPGLYFSFQTVTAVNSIIAGNSFSDCDAIGLTAASRNNLSSHSDCGSSAAVVSTGALNPAWKGTFLLPGTGSPAIDAGNAAACPAVDQRGWTRPVDGDGNASALCDIGAIEVTPLLLELYVPLLIK